MQFSYSAKETNMLFSYILPTSLLMASLLLGGLRAASTSGGSTGCASCGLPPMERDSEERLMIELVKQEILDKLHLTDRPNITQTVPRVAILNALRKLNAGRVRSDGTLELDTYIPIPKDQGYEIVSFAEIEDSTQNDRSRPSLTFQFLEERGHSFQVLQSSLWVYSRSSNNPQRNSRLPAQIYLSGEGDTNRTLVLKKMLEVQKSNWQTFPITRILQSFLDGGQRGLRLEISCEEDGRNLCSLGGPEDSSHQPFLVAQVRLREDPSKHALRKRSLRCGDDVSVCCKRDFYIKFKDIQWQDWIIAPEGYHMNYCMGQCPQHLSGSPGIASSFHATIFSQLKVNGIHTGTSSCCVPTERRPLSMVYINSQHSIIKTDVPNMIVESCGCT